MTPEEEFLAGEALPAGASRPLAALWYVGRGDWERAHDLVNEAPGRDAAWVHAHLHRVEGDLDNAAYWYAQAGRPASTLPLEAERQEIARALLGGPSGG